MKNTDARTLSPGAQEAIRLRAVKAVLDGMKQVKVAKLFSVSTEAMRRWMRLYEQGGESSLKNKKRGRPPKLQLTSTQSEKIVQLIIDNQPDQLELPYVLWTRDAVAQLIKEEFEIPLSRWTVGRYLKNWGFTPQKPAKRASEQDKEAVKQWLEVDYPAIKQEAEKEKAEIHWGDEMGVRSDHQSGRTWGLKGQTPVVQITGKRFRCNVITTLTNRGTFRFMVFSKRFTSPVFIIFLRRMIKSCDKKIYLILDNHSVHRSGAVKKWVAKHEKRIKLFHIPPYSPELNVDELVNNDVKNNAFAHKRASSHDELMNGLRSYLRKIQRLKDRVKRYFNGKNVQYARELNTTINCTD